MNDNKLKNFVNLLGRKSFANYVYELFSLPITHQNKLLVNSKVYPKDSYEIIDLSDEIGEDVFEIRHRFGGRDYQEVFCHIIHSLPLELFNDSRNLALFDPIFKDKLKKYAKRINNDQASWFFPQDGDYRGHSLKLISNNAGLKRNFYVNTFLPKLERLVHKLKIDQEPSVMIGTPDSFFDKNTKDAKDALSIFLDNYSDGISFELFEDKMRIDKFVVNKPLIKGVLRNSLAPCESLYCKTADINDQILKEFEYLLNSRTKESELEKFIKKYYRSIFGPEYDRIETQLWLKFPELDISGSNRKLDIFIRNSIEMDWEIIELKKIINMTKSYRDVPVLTSEIYSAMEQLRNYRDILTQDKVRKQLSKEGIEYYFPAMKLVVGKTPNISPQQWQWLKKNNSNNIKIITFDEILNSLRIRLTSNNFKLD